MKQIAVTLWGALALILVYLSPPALAAPSEVDPALQQRVNQYWEAVRVGNWATAYRLERDAQGPNPKDPFLYMNEKNNGLYLTRVQVESITQQGDTATANIQGLVLTHIGAVSIPIPHFFQSQWARENGNWFHVADQPYTPDWLQAEIDAQAKEEAARLEESARQEEAARRQEALLQAAPDAGAPSAGAIPLPGGDAKPVTQP